MDDMVMVEEDEITQAMTLLLERCKLLVEGAGAVGLAAVLGGKIRVDGRRGWPWCSAAAMWTPTWWRACWSTASPTQDATWCYGQLIEDRPGPAEPAPRALCRALG